MNSGVPNSDDEQRRRRRDEDALHGGASLGPGASRSPSTTAARRRGWTPSPARRRPARSSRAQQRRRRASASGHVHRLPRRPDPRARAPSASRPRRPAPTDDELVDAEPDGEPADRVVLGVATRRRARASRRAPPRSGAPPAHAPRARVERGAHRLGVGVVGVVDDGHAVGALGDLHPPAAARPRRGQSAAATCVERHARARAATAAAASAFATWCSPCSRSVHLARARRACAA